MKNLLTDIDLRMCVVETSQFTTIKNEFVNVLTKSSKIEACTALKKNCIAPKKFYFAGFGKHIDKL